MPEVSAAKTVVVTGAFSYTGKYATRLLLSRGYKVRTLTFHPERQHEFGGQVAAFSYNFEKTELLEQSLVGTSCLINTYWVRFPHGGSNFELAVKNTLTLFRAAKRAGIQRIIHVSIANPSLNSSLGYYRGKAQLEQALLDSGVRYTILRPTVIFGREDILINNIAWFVRHLPVFGIPGDGRYRIRPIYVEDMAKLMADSVEKQENEIIDAVGPETFSFEELVRTIGVQIGKPTCIVHLPTLLAYVSTRLAGLILGDVVLTWEEYQGLMSDLLVTEGPAAGQIRLTDWVSENLEMLGRNYASEVARHFR
jgi:uncharacterized protein YbjT (DUF2867 family)